MSETTIERDGLDLAEEIGAALRHTRTSIKGAAFDDFPAWLQQVAWTHGLVSSPEGYGSADVFALGQHPDGRWVVFEGFCDTTGWDCQAGSDAYVGTDRDEVIRNGMTVEAARALGIAKEGS